VEDVLGGEVKAKLLRVYLLCGKGQSGKALLRSGQVRMGEQCAGQGKRHVHRPRGEEQSLLRDWEKGNLSVVGPGDP
jgi:hypothetical protein